MIRKPKHPIRRLLWDVELYCSATSATEGNRALRGAIKAVEPLLKALESAHKSYHSIRQPDICDTCHLLAAWRAPL